MHATFGDVDDDEFVPFGDRNNAPFLEFTTDENNPSNRVDYGRTYHFGASYKF